jgi:hypothetical protein
MRTVSERQKAEENVSGDALSSSARGQKMSERTTYRDAIQQSSGALNAKTQRARILCLLIAARDGSVSLPDIMACAAQYNARVLELRRLGFVIENKTERVNGARHSWFRLVSLRSPAPKPEPAKSEPECKERPRATGLPLFDLV